MNKLKICSLNRTNTLKLSHLGQANELLVGKIEVKFPPVLMSCGGPSPCGHPQAMICTAPWGQCSFVVLTYDVNLLILTEPLFCLLMVDTLMMTVVGNYINRFCLSYFGNWVTTISDFRPWNNPILPIVKYNRVHQFRTFWNSFYIQALIHLMENLVEIFSLVLPFCFGKLYFCWKEIGFFSTFQEQ